MLGALLDHPAPAVGEHVEHVGDPARIGDPGVGHGPAGADLDADVPVLQISMPRLDPAELFALGRALAPLREEGVLVFGSGFLTHNMRYAFRPGVPEWAREFDAWAESFENPSDDNTGADASRNWDSERRLTEMEADGARAH